MKYLFILVILVLGKSDTPPLNKKVVKYIDTVIGKKVDRGECWDLAAAALDYAGAYLDRSNQKNIYVFGKVINPKQEEIFEGDIIQLENVKIEYTKDDGIYTESMPHHTAIVYEVLDKSHFKIAHQNTSFSGKKVGISEFRLSDLKKGKIIFYRPYKK